MGDKGSSDIEDVQDDELDELLKRMIDFDLREMTEEKKRLFVRKFKGHLKGIGNAVEDLLLPSAPRPSRRQGDTAPD